MVSVIYPCSTQQTLRNISYYSYSNTDNQNYGSQSSDYFNYGSWSNWSQSQVSNSSYSRPVHQSCYHHSHSSNCISSLPYTNNNKSVRKSYIPQRNIAKDYTKPLFVDCSIEYELPNAPKIPLNSEPILMIHPSYYKDPKIIINRTLSVPIPSIHSDEEVQNVNGISKGLKRSYCQISNESSYGYNQHTTNNQDPWLQPQYPQIHEPKSFNYCTYSHYEPTEAKKISLNIPI
uniref:Uncharacterized protein n=1 Tax=Lepeophtheirus salmonis TaxID=72036 RepID=A0A0K2VFJ0_LEPSM